ncbi:MAG: Phosphoribosyl transferase [Candidatus Uhrbacteria bacterium GW2011_GWA2_53_10]|uniref:Phosphoribosyl transferase n=1 Tax=Candidatus Uhrbacteria bacterium GW2011_GWA2_53_10 TaxID=1618980 RepID=A0A0G1XLA2_9BACT|nr:MAG: Phosphoribosyl transferase [Candidatus Uhrbacteria bacterium GW2011_GWA2_53_10]
MVFTDRTQAGNLLAEKLSSYHGSLAVVVGLARGGVVTARAVADALKLPLDVLVVKKIGAPGQEELAIGALAPDGVSYGDFVKSQITILNNQIKQKTLLYRKGRKPYRFREKTVILVDDGAATGATIEAAIRWVRKKHAKKIVVALPVVPKELMPKIAPEVDELVVLETPDDFRAVGQFYNDFRQIGDKEVIELLK